MSEPIVSTDVSSRPEQFGLQLGHRLGSAALLLLTGGIAALFARKPYLVLLVLAFGCADVALLGAFLSLLLGRRAGRKSGEALGAVMFCTSVLLVTIAFLIVSRLRELT